jgi:hypothetical protein
MQAVICNVDVELTAMLTGDQNPKAKKAED